MRSRRNYIVIFDKVIPFIKKGLLFILFLCFTFLINAQNKEGAKKGSYDILHVGTNVGQSTFRDISNQPLKATLLNPYMEVGKEFKFYVGGLIYVSDSTWDDPLFKTDGGLETGLNLEQSFANNKLYLKQGANILIPGGGTQLGYRFYGQIGIKSSLGVDLNLQFNQMILPGFYDPILMQFGVRYTLSND
jgi:hypothetical protein